MTETTTDQNGTLPKQTQLVASPATRAYLGDLGPFMARHAGVDYLMIVSARDLPDGKGEYPTGKNATLENISKYAEKSLSPHLSPELRSDLGAYSDSARAVFFLFAVNTQTPDVLFQQSAGFARVLRLPNNKTAGIILIDEQRANTLGLHSREINSPDNPLDRSEGYTDRVASVAFHELGHIRKWAKQAEMINPQDPTETVNFIRKAMATNRAHETSADQDGSDLYTEALHENLVVDGSLPSRLVLERLRFTIREWGRAGAFHSHDTAHQILPPRDHNHWGIDLSPDHDLGFQRFMRRLSEGIADTYYASTPSNLSPQSQRVLEVCRDVAQMGDDSGLHKSRPTMIKDQSTLRNNFASCVRGDIELVKPVIERMLEGTRSHYDQMYGRALISAMESPNKPAATSAAAPEPAGP